MLEPDWNQDRPTDDDIRLLWAGDVFTPIALEGPAIDEVISEFRRSHVNGGAELLAASFVDHPTLAWFVSRNRFDEVGFYDQFLGSSVIRSAGVEADHRLSEYDIGWGNSYSFAGEIARSIMAGGAYYSFVGQGVEAMELTDRFRYELFGDRYEEIHIAHAHWAWATWFDDIAWDATWIGVDKRERRVWALLKTDSD